jgi:hypothetical protein
VYPVSLEESSLNTYLALAAGFCPAADGFDVDAKLAGNLEQVLAFLDTPALA